MAAAADLDPPERHTHDRARRRRALTGIAITLAALITTAIVMSQFPRRHVPLDVRGPLALLTAAAAVGVNLYYVRADDWQRARALTAFALGGAAGTAWLLVMSLRGGLVHPGAGLAVIGVSWVVADFVLRMWPTMRADSDDE